MGSQRRIIGNVVASVFGVGGGLFAAWASATYLRHPHALMDWAVLVFSALITGTFVFFLTWGHFQKEPRGDEGKR